MALISGFAIKDGARRLVRDGVVGQSAEAAPGLPTVCSRNEKADLASADALAGRQDMS